MRLADTDGRIGSFCVALVVLVTMYATRNPGRAHRYGGEIARLARTALALGILALVFAPGAWSDAEQSSPAALASAVLAPTTMEGGGSTPATPRDSDATALALVALLATALLFADDPRRVNAPRALLTVRQTLLPRRPPHRGPPTLAG